MTRYDQIIEITEDIQYMAEIPQLTPLPSNAIIFKTIPGLGATWNAINENCNLILVLPNVATVKNKQFSHEADDNTFAVFEGITSKHIVKYLTREDIEFKRLLVVPESFSKVKRAMMLLQIDMYKDYRIVLDECHKYTKDVDYRENILTPLEDFFLFKNRVMISATPIPPTDPRFKEYGFKNIKVQPTYHIKKQLNLVYTGSIIEALKGHIAEFTNNHYFIFFNSVNGIKSIIDKLEITDDSKIFCSKDSKKQLSSENIRNVYSEFTSETEPAKYNFLTSSFNTGMDVIIGSVPEVIIISDPQQADFSTVDPFTDVIQIAGRFRKPYEIDRITHIVQKHREFKYLTQEEAKIELSVSERIFQTLNDWKLSATHKAELNVYDRLKARVSPYFNLLNKDQTLNHFKKDNYFDEEKTKGYYSNTQYLISAYEATGHFNITFKEEVYMQREEKLVYKGSRYSKENYATAIAIMWSLRDYTGCEFHDDLVWELVEQYWPEVVDAYYNLPLETIVIKHDFNRRAIKRDLIKAYAEKGKNSHAVIDEVYNTFLLNIPYAWSEIKTELQRIWDLYGIEATATAQDIHVYFYEDETEPTKKIKSKRQRAYRFTGRKYNGHTLLQRR